MNNQTDMRSLRSKGNENGREDDRFNFDVQEYSIDPNKKFLVLRSRIKTSTKEDMGEDNKTSSPAPEKPDIKNTKNLINYMTLDIQKNDISSLIQNDYSGSNSSISDPLIDEVYTSFHRRMLAQENRMHQVDENHSINEAERLILINDKLDMPGWVSTLQRVTVIKNPQDDQELQKKKMMTKQYIKKLLDRYNKMKKHNHVLKKEIKKVRLVPIRRTPKIYQNLDRRYDVEYHSSSDDEEDEDSISNDEIIKRRLHRREKQCGGSIVIGAHSNLVKAKYAIIAEPLKVPSLIMASSAERKEWKLITGMPKELQYHSHSDNQYAKFKRKILIPLTLTSDGTEKDVDSTDSTGYTEREDTSPSSLKANTIEDSYSDEKSFIKDKISILSPLSASEQWKIYSRENEV
ncbi:something about silencing protein 4 [Monosporozyma servazzii]